ncbi:MAG: hypothetical protein P9L92_12475 [Candidatus Electryonea clarkiae]|nr:hypothetical protein [Candidatus Electryonea clarkiae]MDP8287570.1 hypothetical protein [Candidatus Electryonea clarkiae]
MNTQDNWLIEVNRKIERGKINFPEREYKKYKIDKLQRIAKLVSEMSYDCTECKGYRVDIDQLADNLDQLILNPEEHKKNHFGTIKKITDHLTKKHKIKKKGSLIKNVGLGSIILIVSQLGKEWKDWSDPVRITAVAILIIVIFLAIFIGKYIDNKIDKKGELL